MKMSISWMIFILVLFLNNKVLAELIRITKCCENSEIFDGNRNCIPVKGDENNGFRNFLNKIGSNFSAPSWENKITNKMNTSGATTVYTVYEGDFEIFYPFMTVRKKLFQITISNLFTKKRILSTTKFN